MRWIVPMVALGLTGCGETVSGIGVCGGLERPVAGLRSALEGNAAETPEAVGEAATDVVLGFEAGCVK